MERSKIKEGDLITTYYKGIFRLNRIEKRFYTEDDVKRYYKDKIVGDEYSSLYYFTQEYKEDGSPVVTSVEKSCDAAFCKLYSDFMSEEIQSMHAREQMLVGILQKENLRIMRGNQ